MNIALLIARLLLTVVFLVAGLAKLADRAGSQKALRDFGLPAALAAPGGVLLPLAELAVAVLLIPTATAWYGAIGALALLLLFVGGIGYNLARGRRPDCHCFGQIYSAPAGWPTLMRNFLLAAIAGFVVGFGFSNPGLSAVDWFSALAVAQRVEVIVGAMLFVLLIGAGWLLLEMLRQQGRLLLRIEALETQLAEGGKLPQQAANQAVPPAGLPVGTIAPAFALSGLYGETITLDSLRAADRPVALLFSDPGCGPCNSLMPEIGRWQRDYAGKLLLAVISRGTPEANRNKSTEHGITHLLLQKDREIAEAYKVIGTPGAVLVRPDGTIASAAAMGADAIRALVAQAVGLPALNNVPPAAPLNGSVLPVVAPTNGNAAPVQAKRGELAPSFTLPNLHGKNVNLSDFRGSNTLVLFWNPGCGFCQRMLDDLKAWEANPPKGAPKLLLISTGTTESNQALGLRAPVLLDSANMSVGSKFGANGTPMAVLVDAQGRIASELAAGAPAVLALAGVQAPANGSGAPSVLARPKLGETAPAFALPNLAGKLVNLSDFRGKPTLLLFWNPGCGFCQRMLDDLKAWEINAPKGAPRILVVSTGDAESNRAMSLRSTILLDNQNMSVGSKFGATGTPMGILIDAQGRVASDVVVGAQAVLELANKDVATA